MFFVFDAYGTLFDVHSAVERHAAELGDRAAEVSALWRERQLQYTWVRALANDYQDFARVTSDALDYALRRYGISNDSLRERLLAAYQCLDAYPDVASVMQDLNNRGVATAVFSNAPGFMLRSALDHAHLSSDIDRIVTVDDTSIYKPADAAYADAEAVLGVGLENIRFFSSNAWDVYGARRHGWQAHWINRYALPPEYGDSGASTSRSLREAVALALAG